MDGILENLQGYARTIGRIVENREQEFEYFTSRIGGSMKVAGKAAGAVFEQARGLQISNLDLVPRER
jgi:hypothetical protein